MMNKLKDRIIKMFLRKDNSMQSQLFLFMSLLGAIAMLLGSVYTFFMEDGFNNVVPLLLGAFFMGGLFWTCRKFKNYEMCELILVLGINCILLPITFVRSGGLESGMPSWMILCFIGMFFLLRGKSFFIGSICTGIAYGVCVCLAIFYPECIKHTHSKETPVCC